MAPSTPAGAAASPPSAAGLSGIHRTTRFFFGDHIIVPVTVRAAHSSQRNSNMLGARSEQPGDAARKRTTQPRKRSVLRRLHTSQAPRRRSVLQRSTAPPPPPDAGRRRCGCTPIPSFLGPFAAVAGVRNLDIVVVVVNGLDGSGGDLSAGCDAVMRATRL